MRDGSLPERIRQIRDLDDYFKISQGSLSGLAIKVVSLGLGFGVQVVLARMLGKQDYGTYTYAITWITVLVVVAKLGVDSTSVKYVASYVGQEEWGLLRGFMGLSRKVVLICSVLVAALTAVGVSLLGNSLSSDLRRTLWVGYLVIPFLALLQIQSSILLGFKQVAKSLFPEGIFQKAMLLVLLTLVWGLSLDISAQGAMIAYLLAVLLALVLASGQLNRVAPKNLLVEEANTSKREWWKTSRSMFIIASLYMVINRTDVIVIGFIEATEEVGPYVAAARLVTFLTFFLLSVNTVLRPIIAELYAKRQAAQMQRVVSLGVAIVFSTSLAAAAALIVWGRMLLGVFGEDFVGAYPILVVLLIGQVASALTGPVNLLLTMTKYETDSVWITGISAAISLLLNVMLVSNYGAIGAAFATTVSVILTNLLLAILVWKRLGIVALPLPRYLG